MCRWVCAGGRSIAPLFVVPRGRPWGHVVHAPARRAPVTSRDQVKIHQAAGRVDNIMSSSVQVFDGCTREVGGLSRVNPVGQLVLSNLANCSHGLIVLKYQEIMREGVPRILSQRHLAHQTMLATSRSKGIRLRFNLRLYGAAGVR